MTDREGIPRIRANDSRGRTYILPNPLPVAAPSRGEGLRETITRLLPDLDYQIEMMDGRLRPMRTPADGWECCKSQVLALIAAQEGETPT